LLIYSQRPEATRVAGYRAWQRLGRQVRKGARGIAILAPCVYRTKVKDEEGEREHRSLAGFRVEYVFDISQTDGEPIEELDAIRPQLLGGDAPVAIWDALVALAREAGFEVVRERRRNENGYCDLERRIIAVRPGVAPAQATKTLVHELGHALLHADGVVRSRELQEVEVESVAYVVCGALGLDTSDYSFAYVARWSGGATELVKDTAARVIGCAQKILAGLELESSSETG
ncbi:MAG: ArdC-like ssDNA-binding domain-containing protein, partial [Actinomycetota bacterium]